MKREMKIILLISLGGAITLAAMNEIAEDCESEKFQKIKMESNASKAIFDQSDIGEMEDSMDEFCRMSPMPEDEQNALLPLDCLDTSKSLDVKMLEPWKRDLLTRHVLQMVHPSKQAKMLMFLEKQEAVVLFSEEEPTALVIYNPCKSNCDAYAAQDSVDSLKGSHYWSMCVSSSALQKMKEFIFSDEVKQDISQALVPYNPQEAQIQQTWGDKVKSCVPVVMAKVPMIVMCCTTVFLGKTAKELMNGWLAGKDKDLLYADKHCVLKFWGDTAKIAIGVAVTTLGATLGSALGSMWSGTVGLLSKLRFW